MKPRKACGGFASTLDLYQIGWPAWSESPRQHDPGSLEEAWATLAALQQEEKTRFIGVANCTDRIAGAANLRLSTADIEELEAIGPSTP